MSSWTTERASAAGNAKAGNYEAADAARQRLKALKAEEYIRQLVDGAPKLTDEQKDRLALLLRPTA